MVSDAVLELVMNDEQLQTHSHWTDLLAVARCETHVSSAGFPYWCESGFQRFINRIPHLFGNGSAILVWSRRLKKNLEEWNLPPEQSNSMKRALDVMGTVVRTASITAPSDLWLLRQVLGVHRELGLLDVLKSEGEIDPPALAKRFSLNLRQLKIDLHFLAARGYLELYGDAFLPAADPAAQEVLWRTCPLDSALKDDVVSHWIAWFEGKSVPAKVEDALFSAEFPKKRHRPAKAWVATLPEMELGYRLVPLVLALRGMETTKALKQGVEWAEIVPRTDTFVERLFAQAGMVLDGKVTALGARVFERGPGPFGIIAAYYPYMNQLDALLQGKMNRSWVNRGKNVAASQDANRKTFAQANEALDRFCSETSFNYTVFIEHAVGRGEATRQRFALSGDKELRYFGADLEEAAIQQAELEQERGNLPAKMVFIRNADIGDPQKIIEALAQERQDPKGAVMMVGNGFHEIRDQTNQKMLNVLKGYQQAGILLIFTEETGLSDEDLLETAWNTYHAGFRYVHEMSGQGLRPSWDREKCREVWSWRKCARLAGYTVLDRYTVATRTIFPTRKPHRKNPSISVTYFCVPGTVMKDRAIKT